MSLSRFYRAHSLVQSFSSSRAARRKMSGSYCNIFRFGMVTTFATTLGAGSYCNIFRFGMVTTYQQRVALHPAVAATVSTCLALPLGGHPCCGPCSCGSRHFDL